MQMATAAQRFCVSLAERAGWLSFVDESVLSRFWESEHHPATSPVILDLLEPAAKQGQMNATAIDSVAARLETLATELGGVTAVLQRLESSLEEDLAESPSFRSQSTRISDDSSASSASSGPRQSGNRTGRIGQNFAERLDAILIAIVAEQTGYSVEMIDLDVRLEDDLGIDSIKKASILGTIEERFQLDHNKNLSLDDFPTLRHVLRYVEDSLKRELASGSYGKDRLVLMVRDPYWLHVFWEVSRQSVERARTAMAEHWHTAKPTLRLMEAETGTTTSSAERAMRDIPVHGGVTNWYIDVKDPPKSYRVDLGYLSANGKFFVISRSNIVSTPLPGSSDAIDENWTDIAENYEKIYRQSGGEWFGDELQQLFDDRQTVRPRVGYANVLNESDLHVLHFEVDAALIIYGTTNPDARVHVSGEQVMVQKDGSFTVRMTLPDRRQVIPIVAATSDGSEQRTIVLAVERNTKVMEPMTREKPSESKPSRHHGRSSQGNEN